MTCLAFYGLKRSQISYRKKGETGFNLEALHHCHLLNQVQCATFFSAKNPSQNRFIFGAHNIPHPEKAEKGGEDAHHAEDQLLCVADGVGSWNNYGIDPACYSKELILNIGKLFSEHLAYYVTHPVQLMNDAVKKATKFGSSTAVIVTLDARERRLYGANLGDSGYLILRFDRRSGKVGVVFESEEQQHFFNCPF